MILRVVIHCSATPPSMDIGAEEIDQWHKAKGYRSIGYNYVIRRDGRVELGRDEGDVLAHASGYNERSIALCMVGGVSDHGGPQINYEPRQWDSLRVFCDWMRLKYPKAGIMGHRDLPDVMKDCPCFDVRHWLATGQAVKPFKEV